MVLLIIEKVHIQSGMVFCDFKNLQGQDYLQVTHEEMIPHDHFQQSYKILYVSNLIFISAITPIIICYYNRVQVAV